MLGRQKGSAKAALAIIEPVNDGLDKKGPSIHFCSLLVSPCEGDPEEVSSQHLRTAAASHFQERVFIQRET
ncbi:hypothetical protein TA5114_00386 [Cognatishimia activa]|uniref:Uncharacterized protein n=1 Tax=Cognatishimia activa TaxID=1715691 RepID=A0A0P1ILW9_9RHOB|nr:hypothetical protein TA5113_00449 [Cognatishimia activa]CUK24601.1 hypothetical protein TA5114_00386 [Cognatishimia activa]